MANINIGRKSGFIRRGGVMRRESAWLAGVEVQSAIGAGGAVLISGLNALALALRPFTIVCTRGYLWLRSDQIIATEDQTVYYGNAVVSDQAVAIGITAVPTPFTNSASDLWYTYEAMGTALVFSSFYFSFTAVWFHILLFPGIGIGGSGTTFGGQCDRTTSDGQYPQPEYFGGDHFTDFLGKRLGSNWHDPLRTHYRDYHHYPGPVSRQQETGYFTVGKRGYCP